MQQFEEIKTIASKDYIYCLYRYKSEHSDFHDGEEIKSEINSWFVSRMKILYGPIHIHEVQWLNQNLDWKQNEKLAYAFHEKRYALLEKFILQAIDTKEYCV